MKKLFTLGLVLMTSSIFAQTTVPKRPLLEVFTSSTCPPCRPGNMAIDGVLEDYPGQYTLIKYQMNFPGSGDPYFSQEGYSRAGSYSVSGIPDLRANAVYSNPQSFTVAQMEALLAQTTNVEMNLTSSVDAATQTVNYSVDFTALENISSPAYRLFIGIIEKETFNNKKSNGENVFHYVMKKMIPSGSGLFMHMPDGLEAGVTHTEADSYVFNGNYRLPSNANDPIDNATEHSVEEFEDLAVVAFLINETTGEILQSASTPLATSVGETETVVDYTIFPNPSSEMININFTPTAAQYYSIFNANGQLMVRGTLPQASNNFTIPTNEWSNGSYILQIGNTTKTILIQH